MPIILAIETSSELASCALLRDGAVLSRSSSGVRTHSQAILPMIQELLAEAGIALKQCDAIAFGSGPGSFTGVRTACGIAQGLAFGASLPVVPVVTLDAMALACHQQTGAAEVLTVLDARMGEVYWGQYHFDAAGALTVTLAPALSAPSGVQPQGQPRACGNGLAAYADAFGFAVDADADLQPPHAVQVAQLAALALAAGATVSASDAQPLYLRNKIAYTSDERRDIKQAAQDAAATEAAASGTAAVASDAITAAGA